MKNIDIDINQIKHLYYHEKKSGHEIAEILDCPVRVIYDRMKKNGMQRRSYSEAHKLRHAQKGRNRNDPEIVRLYFEEHLTLAEVGKRLGISFYTVRGRLIAMGYERRKGGRPRDPLKPRTCKFTDAELSEMKRLYCEAEQTLAEIAYRYDCSDVAVMTYLKQQGVRVRTVKEAQALRRKKEKARKESNGVSTETRTYTPPKRAGKVKGPYPLLPSEQVTPERILQLRTEEDLMIDDIAAVCSISNVEVYTILQEAGIR